MNILKMEYFLSIFKHCASRWRLKGRLEENDSNSAWWHWLEDTFGLMLWGRVRQKPARLESFPSFSFFREFDVANFVWIDASLGVKVLQNFPYCPFFAKVEMPDQQNDQPNLGHPSRTVSYICTIVIGYIEVEEQHLLCSAFLFHLSKVYSQTFWIIQQKLGSWVTFVTSSWKDKSRGAAAAKGLKYYVHFDLITYLRLLISRSLIKLTTGGLEYVNLLTS